MKRFYIPVGLLLLTATCLGAQEETQPVVRASVEPETAVTVGQPINLIVEVLVPTWFTGAPRYPDIELTDAVVIFQETGGFNFTDRIDGETYAGQRRRYLIYPTRSGTYSISGEAVVVSYAVNARPSPPSPIPIPDVRFEATVPEEAAGLSYFLASTDFNLDARFDRSLDDLKVGDSFTRTFTMIVDDSFAMMIPPLPSPSIEGLAVYPAQPVVSDSGGERGAKRVGKRVEAVTYVMQEEGDYQLPAVEIAWWDSGEGRMRKSTLPEVDFSVAVNPDLVEEIPLPPEEVEGGKTGEEEGGVTWLELVKRWAGPVAIALVVLWLIIRLSREYIPRIREAIELSRRRREQSEEAYFERFKEACLSREPRSTLRHFMFWLDRFRPGPVTATLRGFASSSKDRELSEEAHKLSRTLFAGRRDDTWSARRFCRGVMRARKLQLGHEHAESYETETLTPLNPKS